MLVVTDLIKLKDYGFLNVYEEWIEKGVRLGEETKFIYYKEIIGYEDDVDGGCSLLVNDSKNITNNEIRLICEFDNNDSSIGTSSLDVLFDLIKDGVVIRKEC